MIRVNNIFCQITTVDPKSFVYQFLATLDERGQFIPNDEDNVTRIIT